MRAALVAIAITAFAAVVFVAPTPASPIHPGASPTMVTVSQTATPQAPTGARDLDTSSTGPAASAPPPSPRQLAGARISVPRLGIDLPLGWGDIARDVPRADYAGSTPENVALVFPGSALPGSGGNTYIYSHARAGMFIALWQARTGDSVLLSWPDATLHYKITRVIPRVDPADASWLDPSGPERLTLQTSTGPRASDPRFVAVATPASSD